MASHDDRKLKRASLDAGSMSREAEEQHPASLPMRAARYVVRLATQNPAEQKELKKVISTPELRPQDASSELRELKEKYERLKEVAMKNHRANDDLNYAVTRVANERDTYYRRFYEESAQHQEAQSACHELKKMLQNEQAEKSKLQDQVAQFKKVISSSSNMENQMADDVIHAKSDQIFYSLQAFVVKNFRGVTFDFARIGGTMKTTMEEFAPLGDKLPKAFWLNLINSLIAWVMTESFTPRKFFGGNGKMPVVAAQELASAFEANMDPKWITITRKLLSESAKETLDTSDRLLAECLSTRVQNALHRAVSVAWTSGMHEQLVEIFKRAQEFYRLVYSQQSPLQVVMPKVTENIEFVPETMEIVNGGLDDENELRGRPVEVIVFPALCKMSASSGTTGETSTVVAKAKVVVRM